MAGRWVAVKVDASRGLQHSIHFQQPYCHHGQVRLHALTVCTLRRIEEVGYGGLLVGNQPHPRYIEVGERQPRPSEGLPWLWDVAAEVLEESDEMVLLMSLGRVVGWPVLLVGLLPCARYLDGLSLQYVVNGPEVLALDLARLVVRT